ncbi:CKLF-like MARVEL transmembrane domain-containing protein 8 [Uloborus diversus]|uniref:CKLF-like MARVEL transmembrane domain-containing protein 8 n=1 Tax=Uloborus diversus TaxID=327109 RepID=UPI0024097CB9|nr:CKLF-like MARVEL transmembrane domain-containing protein 8 [Uloborus diversus]
MSQGNVTVTASTTTTKVSPAIRFDSSYIKTLPGILKVAEAVSAGILLQTRHFPTPKIAPKVSSLAGFISVETVTYGIAWSHYTWASFVFISGFCITVVLILFYLFHVVETLHQLPWLIVEGSYDIIWCVFFFAAAVVSTRNVTQQAAWGAAAFFGFLVTFILIYDAFLKYKQWKSGGLAQGERTTTNTN